MRRILKMVVLLMALSVVSESTWAKSFCYTDSQGVMLISTSKRDRHYKTCSLALSLPVGIRKKMLARIDAGGRGVYFPEMTSRRSDIFNYPPNIARYVKEQTGKYNIDPRLVHAIIAVESGFNFNATSSKGALGLMQLMPETAKELAKRENLSITRERLFDPEINITLGVKYLADLRDRYNNNLELMLAAYHAGMGNVAQYDNKIPPFKTTRRYVRDVTCLYNSGQQPAVKSGFCKL